MLKGCGCTDCSSNIIKPITYDKYDEIFKCRGRPIPITSTPLKEPKYSYLLACLLEIVTERGPPIEKLQVGYEKTPEMKSEKSNVIIYLKTYGQDLNRLREVLSEITTVEVVELILHVLQEYSRPIFTPSDELLKVTTGTDRLPITNDCYSGDPELQIILENIMDKHDLERQWMMSDLMRHFNIWILSHVAYHCRNVEKNMEALQKATMEAYVHTWNIISKVFAPYIIKLSDSQLNRMLIIENTDIGYWQSDKFWKAKYRERLVSIYQNPKADEDKLFKNKRGIPVDNRIKFASISRLSRLDENPMIIRKDSNIGKSGIYIKDNSLNHNINDEDKTFSIDRDDEQKNYKISEESEKKDHINSFAESRISKLTKKQSKAWNTQEQLMKIKGMDVLPLRIRKRMGATIRGNNTAIDILKILLIRIKPYFWHKYSHALYVEKNKINE